MKIKVKEEILGEVTTVDKEGYEFVKRIANYEFSDSLLVNLREFPKCISEDLARQCRCLECPLYEICEEAAVDAPYWNGDNYEGEKCFTFCFGDMQKELKTLPFVEPIELELID